MLVSFAVFQYGCAVTGPVVTRQEETAARNQLQLADYRIWWDHQKWLLRVSDRFAWGINTPGASYRNAMGILPVLRKSASLNELAFYQALSNPPDGTILHVSTGSPAESAGIEDGDVIVSIDDRSVNELSLADLNQFASTAPAKRLTFMKRRSGEVKTVSLTPARKLDIIFKVERDLTPNAFAIKYGNTNVIVVSYGIFNLIRKDDELAVFVGHELVHILKRHRLFTRDQEREADYLGMYLAHQVGFNVAVAPRVWERFAVATPKAMYSGFFDNHPANPERFVRIQKTSDEIRSGRTLQEAWNGNYSGIVVASNPLEDSSLPPVRAFSAASSTDSAPLAGITVQTFARTEHATNPVEVAHSVDSANANVSPRSEPRPITKTQASLVQYDGPKMKAGITLEAQFMDDGSGSGAALVTDIGKHMLKGTFATVQSGAHGWQEPKILDYATLNKLQIRDDRPWVISTVSDADTVLECVYGETQPWGQTKGVCQDNYGNRYHVNLLP